MFFVTSQYRVGRPGIRLNGSLEDIGKINQILPFASEVYTCTYIIVCVCETERERGEERESERERECVCVQERGKRGCVYA